jgi:ubiquinone/menaquinone biosynthesis C-methylase UbiE
MKDVEYGRMFEVEDQHWWYLGMETISRAILNRHVPPVSNRQILDAGCGTGAAMANYLPEYGAVSGFDISPLALGMCRLRKLKRLAQASVMEIPFVSGSFDIVTSFDVMVIVDRDVRTVEEFFRVLRPGGFLLLRVAAYDWLRGEHDVTVRTAHRYTVREVARLLSDAGFDIVHLTYTNTLLFPLAAGKRLLERLWPPAPDASDLTFARGVFDGLLRRILASEALIASRASLPFGLSVVALARKPAAAA